MGRCPKCGYITVSRSKKQNNSYWGFSVTPAAIYCGVSPLEFHEDIKREYFEREVPFKTKDGIVFKKVATGTTTEMTTKEFSEYWEWVNRRIFEICGFYPQMPNEPPIEMLCEKN